MKRILLIFAFMFASVPAFAQFSMIADTPAPCTAQPFASEFDEGGNADPTIVTWGGCTAALYVGPNSAGAYTQADQDATFVVNGGIGYSYDVFAVLETPTGCNAIDQIKSYGRWFQQTVSYMGTITDAFIRAGNDCGVLSCNYESYQDFFGGTAYLADPVTRGDPSC